jgi:hypothetical protein
MSRFQKNQLFIHFKTIHFFMETLTKSVSVSLPVAVQYAKLVNLADLLFKEAKKAGDTATKLNPSLQAYKDLCSNKDYQALVDPNFLTNYNVLYNVQMNDVLISGIGDLVYYGFIAQNKSTKDYVIAIRGTENILEAIADAFFIPTTFNEFNNNSLVPSGFYDLYKSGQIVSLPDVTSPITPMSLTSLTANPVAKLPDAPNVQTIVSGHSLGASLATYYAAAAAMGKGKGYDLCLYTYASPMSGDTTFADTFNNSVPDSIRIHNLSDIVPSLPKYPVIGQQIYTQVNEGYQIDSKNYPEIKTGALCAHQLWIYEYVLESLNGNADPDILNFNSGNCKATS